MKNDIPNMLIKQSIFICTKKEKKKKEQNDMEKYPTGVNTVFDYQPTGVTIFL